MFLRLRFPSRDRSAHEADPPRGWWWRRDRQLTAVLIGIPQLNRLASGETVLFLAERATSSEVQSRIVDLLVRIGINDWTR